MRFVKTIVCVTSLALGSSAYAQDQTPPEGTPAATAPATAATNGGGGYQGPEINRTLTMPQGGIEGELQLGVGHTSASTGEDMNLGFRYGVMPNLNAGAALGFRLNPDANFSNFLVNGEYELTGMAGMMLAPRVDLGVTRLAVGMASTTLFDIGLGLPLKYSINPMISFISGSQYSLRADQDIIFISAGDATVFYLTIPLGIMAQLTPMVAVDFWTGFRLIHTDAGNLKFVPINIDAIGNLGMIDAVFTFSLPGNTDDYAGAQNFLFGARVHL